MKQDNQQNAEQIPQQNVEQIIQQKPKNFTGREALLKQLSKYLNQQSITVLTNPDGLAGFGKTYLAREFAFIHLKKKCIIQFQTKKPSETEKKLVLAGKLLLVISNEKGYHLGFCYAPTQSYCEQKISDNNFLNSLKKLLRSNLIIDGKNKGKFELGFYDLPEEDQVPNNILQNCLTELLNSNLIIDDKIRQSIFSFAKTCDATLHYDNVFWFDATNKTILQQEYLKLAEKFGCRSTNPTEYIQFIKRLLDKKNNHLLVYDNAENPATLQTFLPSKNKNIIITSRCSNWPENNVLNVDVFTLEESVKFIKETLNSEQKNEDIIKLAKALGRLPLALATGCAYLMKNPNETIQSYLQKHQKYKKTHSSESTIHQLDNHDRLALAWTYESLGNSAFHLGNLNDAKFYYECALTLFKKRHGNVHLDVWRVTVKSALLFDKLRDFKRAFLLVDDVYRRLKQEYPNHALTKTVLEVFEKIKRHYFDHLRNSVAPQIKVTKRKREESQKTTLAQQKTNKLFKNGYPLPTPLPLLLEEAKNLFQKVSKKLQPRIFHSYERSLYQIEASIHQKKQNKTATQILEDMINKMKPLLAAASEEETNNKNS